MKDHFPFFGIKSGRRNEVLREFISAEGLPANWQETALCCWKEDEREMHYLGMEVAWRSRRKMAEGDLKVIEYLITHKSWWDTVDFLASRLAGHYFHLFPAKMPATVKKWSASDNMWLIRTAILFQLNYKENTDFSLLKKLILDHNKSGEFFIRKAIGWALRQYARTDAKAVKEFVEKTEMSGLSKREAMKHI